MAQAPRPKPGHLADAEAAELGAAADAAVRGWWRRVPQVITRPREVFRALADPDELELEARAEPVLAISVLAATAALLLTPAAGSMLDDSRLDGVVLLVLIFLGALVYGAAVPFLLGLAIWIGARGAGAGDASRRVARHVVVFAATPLVLALVVLVTAIAITHGWDWFRTDGGNPETRRAIVAVGLGFVVWSVALLVVGLRETFRLNWLGVVTALALGGVLVAAIVLVPRTLLGA